MFEQFLSSFFGPKGAGTGATHLMGAAGGGKPAINAGIDPVQQAILNAIVATTKPTVQPNNGSGDLAAILKATQGDPLGAVARSNSRPSGFTPRAEWDAWGPSARKPGPTPDAVTALHMGGGGGDVRGQAFTGPYGSGSVSQVAPQTTVPAGPPPPPGFTVPSGKPPSEIVGPMQGPTDLLAAFRGVEHDAATHQAPYSQPYGPFAFSEPPLPTPSAVPLGAGGGANPMDAYINPGSIGAAPPAPSWTDQVARAHGATWDGTGWSTPPPADVMNEDVLSLIAAGRGGNITTPYLGSSPMNGIVPPPIPLRPPQPQVPDLLSILAQAFGAPSVGRVQ